LNHSINLSSSNISVNTSKEVDQHVINLNKWNNELDHKPVVRAVATIHHLTANIAPEFGVIKLINKNSDNQNNENKTSTRLRVFV